MQRDQKPPRDSPKGQRQKAGGAGHQAPTPHAGSWSSRAFSMQIFVQDTSNFTNIPIAIPATATVAQLKALVYSAKRNIHPEHQRLSFGNRVLDDERSLSDYNISHESTVVLQYGPKFPFAWRPPPKSSAQDFELPTDASKGHAHVSTVLGGSKNVNATPFSPLRSYVPNVQLTYSTVKRVPGSPVQVDGLDAASQGSLGTCTNLSSSDVAWEPMEQDTQQWMEFDLLELQDVAGIQTVGSVQSMKILFRSSPHEEWSDLFSKPFTGSSVIFDIPVPARYVRICPLTWAQHIRMRADVLVMPSADISPAQCCVLPHSSLAFSHIGPMLLIPQNFPKPDGSATTQLCVYHCSSSGLKPWLHPPVCLSAQTSILSVCVSPNQTAYVANSNYVYRVSLDGTLETFCGGAGSGSDGTGVTAGFSSIKGIVAGPNCMFLLDNQCVRSVTYSGVVKTIAGHIDATGTADGPGAAARFSTPRGICLDNRTGVIYVTESNRIRSVDANNEQFQVATVAGSSNAGFSEGIGTAATFNNPQGIAVIQGWLFVCDTNNHCVRKIAPDGRVSVAAGCAMQSGHVDAKFGYHARFASPSIICAGEHGQMYVSHGSDGFIRRFTADIFVSPYPNPSCGSSDLHETLHALSTSEDHRELCDWSILTDRNAVFACSALIKLRCPHLATKISSLLSDGRARLPGCNQRSLQMLIDYVHSDVLSMPVETKEDIVAAVELLMLSDEHELPGLKAAVSRRLNRSINCENVCNLLVAAEQHEADELRGACLQFAVFNFARVRSSPAFESLPVGTIMDIVKRISL